MPSPNPKRLLWHKEPEKTEWMLEHCNSMSYAELIDAFEEEFGIRLTKPQVCGFKRMRGIRAEGSRGPAASVGEQRMYGGYVYVKISDDKENYKDNWRPKSVVEWERANRRPLPDGHKIIFIDGDRFNFDPDNLLAVSKERAAILPRLLNAGATYSNREELETLLAIGSLESAIVDARNRPKTCRVCGKTFVPTSRHNKQDSCQECRDQGKRAPGWPRHAVVGRGICEKCGMEFDKKQRNQVRCSECSAKRRGR